MVKPFNPKTTSPRPAGGSKPHWLIEPTKAIIGFESILQNYATGSEGLWKQAWNDAVNGQIRGAGPAVAANELGLLMNSYGYRDQHQVGGGRRGEGARDGGGSLLGG